MQGGAGRNLAKSHQISIAWNGCLPTQAGRERAGRTICAQQGGVPGCAQTLGIVRSNPYWLRTSSISIFRNVSWNLGRLEWDSELGYANAAAKLLGLNRCRQSRCGNRSEAKRRALALADTRSRKMPAGTASCLPSSCPTSPSLLVLEGLDIAITGTEKLSVCDAGNVGS